jgi:hypothetical protein
MGFIFGRVEFDSTPTRLLSQFLNTVPTAFELRIEIGPNNSGRSLPITALSMTLVAIYGHSKRHPF